MREDETCVFYPTIATLLLTIPTGKHDVSNPRSAGRQNYHHHHQESQAGPSTHAAPERARASIDRLTASVSRPGL